MKPGELVGGRFELLVHAGSGGMGSVFRARDLHTGGLAAVKCMHSEGTDTLRFEREAEVLGQIEHPGIVRYLASGSTDRGERFLAMEWLEGKTLGERLEAGRLGVDETLVLGSRIAEALAAAHERGIVHRDIKPRNIVLVGDDVAQATLVDFGLARNMTERSDITRSGVTLGTPGYMAPEQARGESLVDARADVFSLGCILYVCLTGRAPFVGEDMLAVLVKTVLEDPPAVAEVVHGIGAPLDRLVRDLLQKDRARRPPDGSVVALRLGAIAWDGPAQAQAQAIEPEPAPPELTTEEQRICCIVLAREVAPRRAGDAHGANRNVAREGEDPNDAPPITLPDPSALDVRLRAVAGYHGGTLDVLSDGTVMVSVRGASDATDLAAGAARCALAMGLLWRQAAIAVIAGRSVPGAPARDAVDHGTALLAACRPGTICLDEVAVGLLESRFEVVGGAGAAILREERNLTRGQRTLLGRATPCVGREREIGMLEALLSESVGEPLARAVLVTAEAGIGKSRLREEFVDRAIERHPNLEVWIAQGQPLRASSPLGIVSQLLRWAAVLYDDEPAPVRRSKLSARIARHVPAARRARVAEFSGELTGAAFPDDDSPVLKTARHDPVSMGEQLRLAWCEFLHAECAAHPLLIVIEDIQWADAPSVRFLDAALREVSALPLMVLALARPEVHETFPRLWSDRRLQHVRLEPLTVKSSERLVRAVLGADVAQETVDHVTACSAGNAFYLEELIRAHIVEGANAFPDTVLAMVESRIEALPAEARRVLRAASILGESFRGAAVASLLGGPKGAPDLDRLLALLVERELLAQRPSIGPEALHEYSFRHALLREGAYAMLTDADRRLGHQLAGEWLVAAGEGAAAIVAAHFERGGDPERALAWHVRATEQALEGGDIEEVDVHAERAVACGAKGKDLGYVRLLQSEGHAWHGAIDRADDHAFEALELLPHGSALASRAAGALAVTSGHRARIDRFVVAVGAIHDEPNEEAGAEYLSAATAGLSALLVAGLYAEADSLLGRIEMVTDRIRAAVPAADGWLSLARGFRALYADGDVWNFLGFARVATEAFDAGGDVRATAWSRWFLGWALRMMGDAKSAEQVLRGALERAPSGIGTIWSAIRYDHALALAYGGRLEDAVREVDRAAADLDAAGNRMLGAVARLVRARVLLLCDDPVEAASDAERAASLLETAPPLRAQALAVVAAAGLCTGRVAEAREAAKDAMLVLAFRGAVGDHEALVWRVEAETLWATGDEDAARSVIARARARLLQRAAIVSEPVWRAAFLERVPDNVRVLELARAWVGPEEQAPRG